MFHQNGMPSKHALGGTLIAEIAAIKHNSSALLEWVGDQV